MQNDVLFAGSWFAHFVSIRFRGTVNLVIPHRCYLVVGSGYTAHGKPVLRSHRIQHASVPQFPSVSGAFTVISLLLPPTGPSQSARLASSTPLVRPGLVFNRRFYDFRFAGLIEAELHRARSRDRAAFSVDHRVAELR